MNLIEEAVIVEIAGIRMYAFGAYTAIGALFALIVLCFSARILSLKKETAPISFLCAAVCGLLLSRITFCLLNRELGRLTPLSFWIQINGGGWSMFGLLGGIFLGGFVSAKLTKEKTGSVLDSLCLAVLPLIASERFGEHRIEDFDISRPLDNSFLSESFLSTGGGEPCLATYYVAGAAAIVIFLTLSFRLAKRERQGNLTIAFLMLFGASSVITESLRYDRFLSISFVGLQQVAAALMLALGIIFAGARTSSGKNVMKIAAFVSIPLMAGAVVALEFALDRTTWNKILIYIAMIITVSIPAAMGMNMISTDKRETNA